MPYIKGIRRAQLRESLKPENPGEVNYLISYVLDRYFQQKEVLNYQVINDCVGALECAKLELYRRLAGPYEDIKLKENGEVYHTWIGNVSSST